MNSRTDQPLELEALLALPAQRTVVLTVNNRLSRGLLGRLGRATQRAASPIPTIVPWGVWLAQKPFELTFAQPLPDDPVHVLDTTLARALWTDVIRHSAPYEDGHGVLDLAQLASLAAQADALMLDWHVQVDPSWETPEYEQFSHWQEAYVARLEGIGAIDRARIALTMPRWIAQGRIALPEHVVLAGFAQYSPAMQEILDALEAHGVSIHALQPPVAYAAHPPQQLACASNEDEWHQALAWARHHLQNDSQGRYAIIVPDLEAQAVFARRLLHATFGEDEPYNLSVAPALAHWPAARAMLAWLQVAVGLSQAEEISVEVAGQALLSGHCVGHRSESGARAQIDARWRRRQAFRIDQAQWDKVLGSLPHLARAWGLVAEIWTQAQDGRASWEAWTHCFRQTLNVLGFPGDQIRTSVQFQCVQALDDLLLRLGRFDDFLDPVGRDEALAMLAALAHETLFQPQRDRRARLDVLGLLEAEGGRWDAVWVMGLTDTVLPAAVSPNPLLPRTALAQAQAPRSTPEGEKKWAQRMFASLCDLAASVTLSWPERNEQQDFRPSPFLKALPLAQPPSNGEARDDEQLERLLLESWRDGMTPALLPDEQIRGGVTILETQSRNPMWAFLRHRLATEALQPYANGPTRAHRGTFLHAVMRTVWAKLGSLAQLQKVLSEPTFESWLDDIVVQAAQKELQQWPQALVRLECERTHDMITQWLQMESRRCDFAPLALEQKYVLELAGLTLSLSIDRIDRTACDDLILIDYKTGASCPNPARDWSRPSPIEVQMLAYARVIRQTQGAWPQAIVWARLHPAKVEFSGTSVEDVTFPGVAVPTEPTQTWEENLQRWDASLTMLGEQFTQGQAENVSWRTQDLQYCDLKSLLNLHLESDSDPF